MSSQTTQYEDHTSHITGKGIGSKIFSVLIGIILVVGLMPTLNLQSAYAATGDDAAYTADTSADETTETSSIKDGGGATDVPVTVADDDIVLTIVEKEANDDVVRSVEYTQSDLEGLVGDETPAPQYYQQWQATWTVYATDNYVTMADLFEASNITISDDDLVTAEAADTTGNTYTWEGLNSGKFYEECTWNSDELRGDGVSVEPIIALNYGRVTLEAGETCADVMEDALTNQDQADRCPRNFMGIMTVGDGAGSTLGNRFTQSVTTLTVMHTSDNPSEVLQTWEIGSPNAEDVTATLYGSGLMKVTGSGDTETFTASSGRNANPAPWYSDYRTVITSVTFEDTVATTNLNYWFYGCTSLEAVPENLPDTATSMEYAFSGCTSITSLDGVNIPESMQDMSYAFYDTDSIKTVNGMYIPNGVTNMSYIFDYCDGLESLEGLTIPASVTNLNYAFRMNTSLTTAEGFEIASGTAGLTVRGAFYYDTALTTLGDFQMPGDVTDLYNTFNGCSALEELPENLTIPATVTTMNSAFYGCSSLTALPEGFTIEHESGSLDMSNCFSQCNKLTELPKGFSFPTGATTNWAFLASSPYSSSNLLTTYCDAEDYVALSSAYNWTSSNRELVATESHTVTLDANDGTFTSSVAPESDVSVWDGTTATAVDDLTTDANDVYQLNSAEDLAGFRDGINENFEDTPDNPIPLDADAVLTVDCDMSATSWTPIGYTGTSASPSVSYTGTFDGRQHTITLGGETTGEEAALRWGLFGVVYTPAVIENLTVDGSYNLTATYRSATLYAGAFAAQDYGGATFVNCVNKMNIDATTTSTLYVGGIVGYPQSSLIYNCGNVGNIAGTDTGTSSQGGVGGIAGYVHYRSGANDGRSRIENCYNWGDISVTSGSTNTSTSYIMGVGGIAGRLYYAASSDADQYIYNCYSAGDITAALTSTGTVQPYGGAIVGYVQTTSGRYQHLERCYWPADLGLDLYGGSGSDTETITTDGSGTYSDAAELRETLNGQTSPTDTTGTVIYAEWIASNHDDLPFFGYTADELVLTTGADGKISESDYQEPTRVGYTFAGWNTASDGSGDSYDRDGLLAHVFEDDETIYAMWDVITYTVTLNANKGTFEDGSDTLVITTNEEGMISESDYERPTRAGYTFLGWNTEADGSGNSYTEGDLLDRTFTYDMTFYAEWTNVMYTITCVADPAEGGTLEVNDGTEEATQTTPITVTATPAAGYELKRIVLTDSGSSSTTLELDGNSATFDMPASDVTLTATFVVGTYEVTLNGNGGTFTFGVDEKPEDMGSSTWDGTSDVSWYNTTDTTFVLTSAEQLAGLADITSPDCEKVSGTDVKSGEAPSRATYENGEAIMFDNFEGKTVKLAVDVDLNNYVWFPISDINVAGVGGQGVAGSTFDYVYWQGTFDGCGHVITNINVDGHNNNGSENYGGYQGLFSCIGLGGVIRNVGVQGTLYARVGGGIVGCSFNSNSVENTDISLDRWPRVENCWTNVAMSSNGSSSRASGGIFGGEADRRGMCNIINCYSMGTLYQSAGAPLGGISGFTNGIVAGCYSTATELNGGSLTAAITTNLLMPGYSSDTYKAIGVYANNAGLDNPTYRYITSGSYDNTTSVNGKVSEAELEGQSGVELLGGGSAWVAIDGGSPELYWEHGELDINLAAATVTVNGDNVTVTMPDGTVLNEYTDYFVVGSGDNMTVYGVGRYTGYAPSENTELILKTGDNWKIYGNEYQEPVREGYVFAGWCTDRDGNGDIYTTEEVLGMKFKADTTLYAIWSEIESVTVTLNGNGGTFGEGGTTEPDVWNGDDSKTPERDNSGVYQITSAAELAGFRDLVNQGNYLVDAKLTIDCDMSAANWEPIAPTTNPTSSPIADDHYAGTFDGGNHTITLKTDTTIESGTNYYWGLFGFVGFNADTNEGGVIKNVTVDGTANISDTNNTLVAAGVAAYSFGATIINCTNKVNITTNMAGTSSASSSCGGILGYDKSCTIVNCANLGNLSATSTNNSDARVGGIVGESSLTATYGGRTCIENCYNWGTLNAEADHGSITYMDASVGGIIGYANNATSGKSNYFRNCYSTDTVSGSTSSGNAVHVGTVVGFLLTSSSSMSYLQYCYYPEGGKLYGDVNLTYYEETDCAAYADASKLLGDLNGHVSIDGASGETYAEWIASGNDGLPWFGDSSASGSGNELVLTVGADGKLDLTEGNGYQEPHRDGYTFIGWSRDEAGEDMIENLADEVFTASTTIYAQWELTPYEINTSTPDGHGSIGVTVDGRPSTTDPATATMGQEVTVTVTPDPGYEIENVTITDEDGSTIASGTDATYTFDMPASNVTVDVVFKMTNYTITVDESENGSIGVTVDGTPSTTATYGQSVTVDVTPDAGYAIKSVTISDEGSGTIYTGTDATYTFNMPPSNVTVEATFTAIPYDIVVDPVDNGEVSVTVDGTEATTATIGQEIVVTVTPDEGYEVGSVTVKDSDGNVIATGTDDSLTFDMPADGITVEVEVSAIDYQITVEPVDNGEVSVTVDGTEATTATIGQEIVVTVTPGADYEIENVTIKDADGNVIATGTDATYTFTMPANGVTVEATMSAIEHHIEVEADDHGTVTIDHEEATTGEPISFRVTANAGYEIADVVITDMEGNDITDRVGLVDNGDGTYTFVMPDIDVDVQVTFREIPKTPLDASMFTVDTSSVTYTGDPIEKTITSTIPADGYEVTYTNNVDAGTATITITGTGDYEGTLTYTFQIERAFVRLAGDDRYGTMEEIDDAAFESADTVVLAAGSNFPDALSAAGLAGTLDAPIVLTTTDELSAEAAEEIERLGAKNIVIVGGENSVSDAVVATLEASGLSVTRVSGADRYATAVEAYYAGEGNWGTSDNGSAKTAIIAAGASFPDTLSASSYAWWSTSPIFLSSSTGLSDETAAAITSGGFERIIIVGGPNSVPADVETWAAGVADTQRLAGDSRYDTSVEFATWAVSEGMSFNNAGIATGKNFPDALAGGALCGRQGSVVLLADYDGGTQAVVLLAAHKSEISRLYYLGGVNSVTPELTALIEATLS